MAQETSDMNEPVLHPAPAEGFGAAIDRDLPDQEHANDTVDST